MYEDSLRDLPEPAVVECECGMRQLEVTVLIDCNDEMPEIREGINAFQEELRKSPAEFLAEEIKARKKVTFIDNTLKNRVHVNTGFRSASEYKKLRLSSNWGKVPDHRAGAGRSLKKGCRKKRRAA